MLPRELVSAERANLLPPLYKRARAEGSIRVEFSLPDGRTLDLALSPILADGKMTVSRSSARTSRSGWKRKARSGDAEMKYRKIFDEALEGIFQTSPEGRLLTVNPALARMLGYQSVGELLSTAHDVSRRCLGERK